MKENQFYIPFLAVLFFLSYFWMDHWKPIMNNGDSSGYYMHLTALFIHHDTGDYSKSIQALLNNYPNAQNPKNDQFGIRKTEKGKYYIKYTLGVALMELPAFLVGHAIASISPTYKADGWSAPYTFSVHISKLLYVLFGIILLGRVLIKFFRRQLVWLCLFALIFATNLFFHSTCLSLAHPLLFFDFCLLIFLTDRYYINPSGKKAFYIGATIGLISLTRVPEILAFVVPIFWSVKNKVSLINRVNHFKKNVSHLILAILGCILLFLPQLIYWYFVSGQLLYNPYQGENFNFLSPNILDGWFNFKNGWLIYTPIMLLALSGLIPLIKKKTGFLLPIMLFLLLNSWIHYSYYTWNYYPGFGSRPMIESYPLLAFGLAAFIEMLYNKRNISWFIFPLIFFFTWLNIHQSWQSKEGLIDSARGNPAFYISSFGKMKSNIKMLRSFETKMLQPNPNKLIMVDTLSYEGFEINVVDPNLIQPGYKGDYALANTQEKLMIYQSTDDPDAHLKPKDWIYLSCIAMREQKDMVWSTNGQETLSIRILDAEGNQKIKREIKISSFIGNDNFSIWHMGKPGVWSEAGFYMQLPRGFNKDWIIEILVSNPSGQRLIIDELTVIHLRSR